MPFIQTGGKLIENQFFWKMRNNYYDDKNV